MDTIVRKYFGNYPRSEIISDVMKEVMRLPHQQANRTGWLNTLADAIFFSACSRQYSPPLRYKCRLLRDLIQELEQCDVEEPVPGCYYQVYSSLICHNDTQNTTATNGDASGDGDTISATAGDTGVTAGDTNSATAAATVDTVSLTCTEGYVIYWLHHQLSAVILEDRSLLAAETTGVRTWQAAKSLLEWFACRPEWIQKRNVLELGSGLGFLGISLCRVCRPRSYTLTDSHHFVLKRLAHNVSVNARPSLADTVNSPLTIAATVHSAPAPLSQITSTATADVTTATAAATTTANVTTTTTNNNIYCSSSANNGDQNDEKCGKSDHSRDHTVSRDCCHSKSTDSHTGSIDSHTRSTDSHTVPNTPINSESGCTQLSSDDGAGANRSGTHEYPAASTVVCRAVIDSVDVSIRCLDWTQFDSGEARAHYRHIDLVIASDVSYSTALHAPFCRTLSLLLECRQEQQQQQQSSSISWSDISIIIALTERNASTLQHLLSEMVSHRLKATLMSVPPNIQSQFHMDESSKVKIFSVARQTAD